MNIDFQKDNARVKASSELWQLYEEARNLDASMQEYKRTFQEQQDLTLLKQALVGGQISMIEYFVEVSVVYQSKTNLLQLENHTRKQWRGYIRTNCDEGGSKSRMHFHHRLRQIAATDTPLLRIKIIGTVTYILTNPRGICL